MKDLEDFESLNSYDFMGNTLYGVFREGDEVFEAYSFDTGYSVTWSFDGDVIDVLDGFSMHVPFKELYLSDDRKNFREVDPGWHHMYELEDNEAVKAVADELGVMWYRDNDDPDETEVRVFSKQQGFDYHSFSVQPIDWIIPELTSVDLKSPLLKDIREFAEIDEVEEMENVR